MELRREVLLSALKAVKPAIAESSNQLEALSHVWFDGKTISAFDDIVGIQVNFATDFAGGVLGAKLLGVLEKSDAETITIERGGDKNLILRQRPKGKKEREGSDIKFALKSIDDWFWQPVVPKSPELILNSELVKAISSLMFSVGRGKVLSPEQRGITFIQEREVVNLYSTDLETVSWVNLEQQLLDRLERVIVPVPFCEQLTKFKPDSQLLIGLEGAYLRGEVEIDEDQFATVIMHANLIKEDDPVPFSVVTDKYKAIEARFPVPARMHSSLNQAIVLLGDNQPIEMQIDDREDEVSLFAQSPYGHFDDILSGVGDHPFVKVKVDAGLLKRGLEGRSEMAVTRDYVVALGPDEGFVHIVMTK